MKKHLIPNGYSYRTAAGMSVVCILLSVFPGCLDLSSLEAPEPDVNTAPVFLEDRVLPRPSRTPIVADIGDDCVHTRFQATAMDYDGDAVLYAKWLMHAVLRSGAEDVVLPARQLKEEQVVPTQVEIAQYLGEDIPGAVIYRDLELELSRETLLNAFDNPGALAEANGSHLLELYVSDRRFGAGNTNVEPVELEGEPLALVAYASWLIDLDDTPNCGDVQ